MTTDSLAARELPLFEPPAVEAIFQATRALPSKVNRLPDYALTAAAIAKAKAVTVEHVQKLAVYDLCRLIGETLWQHDRDGLLEAMIRDNYACGFNHADDFDHRNLALPFDDDLSF